MTPAMSVSVAGLQDAATRLATAASRVSRNSADSAKITYSDAQSSNQLNAAASPARPVSQTTRLSEPVMADQLLYTPSYAEDMISMKNAIHAYKANARMIKTLGETTDALLAATKHSR
jgi:hypothetical protein